MVQLLDKQEVTPALHALKKQEKKVKVHSSQIGFGYGQTKILQDVNIDVQEGEFLVLMGPSGCGKSTYLRLLSGLTLPQHGEVIIDGVSTKEASPNVGVVFQDYSLFPWLSAKENIALALKQNLTEKKSKKELLHLAEDYLHLVQLSHAIEKYPNEMSGGMKQRAAIARALAYGSDLMLMDEPFGALDVITRIHLQDLLLQISRDQKRTIVFVTHDADEAIYLADRIIVFSTAGGSAQTTSVDVPFKKPRDRQQLFNQQDFIAFRENLFAIMNKGILDSYERKNEMNYAEGI